MKKYIFLGLFLFSVTLSFSQVKKKEAVMKDTIGTFLTGKRYAVKSYIRNKVTQVYKDDDYLWFREDGILETALLGYEDRATWKWDTTNKVILVKYNDGKIREWGISFNSEEIKAWNDFEEFKLKNETSLDNVAPAGGKAAPFCKSWLVQEHMKGNTKVEYKYMDFMRIHGNGVYEQSTNGKYLRGEWKVSEDGTTLTITINKKAAVWTVTEWKKDKLYMKKDGPETIILKPEKEK
jgi:hypothetical protein